MSKAFRMFDSFENKSDAALAADMVYSFYGLDTCEVVEEDGKYDIYASAPIEVDGEANVEWSFDSEYARINAVIRDKADGILMEAGLKLNGRRTARPWLYVVCRVAGKPTTSSSSMTKPMDAWMLMKGCLMVGAQLAR